MPNQLCSAAAVLDVTGDRREKINAKILANFFGPFASSLLEVI
jgi:hypothetical protein